MAFVDKYGPWALITGASAGIGRAGRLSEEQSRVVQTVYTTPLGVDMFCRLRGCVCAAV